MTRAPRWILIGLIAVAAVLPQRPAGAQSMCGTRAHFVKTLAERYQESPRFIAVAARSMLMEVFASKAGTWTILMTRPDKITCIFAAGDSWEALPVIEIKKGRDL